MSEFARDVARVRDGMPVEARPSGVLYQMGCFARRNLWAVVGSSVALFLICGLAVWGFISAGQAQRERAVAEEKSRQLEVSLRAERAARLVGEEQKKKAEEQGELARHLGGIARDGEARAEARVQDLLRVFDSLIVSARWDVSKLPGGTSAAIKMLEKALRQIEVLEPTPAARANFLLLRAEAHSEVAELYGGANSNVGNKEGAARNREKAVQLWEELRRIDGKNVNWERGWLDARFRIVRDSLRASAAGSPERWKSWTDEYEGLLGRAPKNRLVARSVGSFYFFRAFGSPFTSPQRRTDFEKALLYFRRNVDEDGGDPFILRDMALAHKYLAGLVGMESGQRMDHASEAVRLDRVRVKQDGNDAGARMDLAFSINAVADAHMVKGDNAAAQPGYLESFLIRKGLALSDPNNAFVLRSLLYPIRLYGVMSARLKDWKALGGAVKEMEWAAEASRPKAGGADLATLNYWKGLLALEAADRVGACRYGREASRLLEVEKGKDWIENPLVLKRLLAGCEGLTR